MTGAVGPQDAVTVAVCQLAPVLGDVAGNLERACAAARSAVARGASVVVLPELVTTGYAFESARELRPLAETSDGPSLRAIGDLARETGAVVVGGFAELDGDRVHNSAFLVDGSGLRAIYRKVHLWDAELDLFAPGSSPPPVVDTRAGRIAVLVCYDLEFPEWSRTAALLGAQLVCVPTNWPALEWPAGEHAPQLVHAQAAAMASRIFVAVCDRVGAERGADWAGGSGIVSPDGYPLAETRRGGGVQTVFAQCELQLADRKRTSLRNHALNDRRPDLYTAVTLPPAARHPGGASSSERPT
jgi:predicted amidohydrolase